MTETLQKQKTQFASLKTGGYLSRTSYYKILDPSIQDTVQVKNEEGFDFYIGRNIVENEIYTPDQFTETVAVTKTEMAKYFLACGDTIFKVVYYTLPKKKDISEAINNINNGKFLSKEGIEILISAAYKGNLRTLIGRRLETFPLFGRSDVIDMEIDKDTNLSYDNRRRQVNHNTIQEFIYKNVRYILRK
ncbi:hypothetical protein N9933_01060 [bacterium]|nr:hypothetical protein [bacterium]